MDALTGQRAASILAVLLVLAALVVALSVSFAGSLLFLGVAFILKLQLDILTQLGDRQVEVRNTFEASKTPTHGYTQLSKNDL